MDPGRSPSSRAGSQGLNSVPAPYSPGTWEPFPPPLSPSTRVLPSRSGTSGTTMPFPVRAPCLRYALGCRDPCLAQAWPWDVLLPAPTFPVGPCQGFGIPGQRIKAVPTPFHGSSFQRPLGSKPARGHSGVKQKPREQRGLFGFVFMFTYLVSFKGKGEHPNKEEKENPSGLLWIPGEFP